ncbi:MAG TPA: hypothetical protein VE569_08610, partial [Acidimicrobiia bacterium]|nr:hypothetical protein [Acidimicrobiia bacterium]
MRVAPGPRCPALPDDHAPGPAWLAAPSPRPDTAQLGIGKVSAARHGSSRALVSKVGPARPLGSARRGPSARSPAGRGPSTRRPAWPLGPAPGVAPPP